MKYKLYRKCSKGLQIPYAIDGSRIITTALRDSIPMVFWPDGRVCWEGNLFLLGQARYKKKSVTNGGGTVAEQAKNLSHLIRFCFEWRIDFVNFDDHRFRTFIHTLKSEKKVKDPSERYRSDNQVITIASTCLSFFKSIDDRYNNLNLLVQLGAVETIPSKHLMKFGRRESYWTHNALPARKPTRKRVPISDNAVDRLYEANATLSTSEFIYRRRFAFLRSLEITGGRRIEVAFLKVRDVEDALITGELKVFTAKKRDADAIRFIPVTKTDLHPIIEFIKFWRNPLVSKKGKNHDWLFVSARNGTPLAIDTHGNEMSALAKEAGIIDEEVCIHAFRHRYITLRIRQLIEIHNLENEEDVKKFLVSSMDITLQLMEWTGHSSPEGLDPYIHHAFIKTSGFDKSLDILRGVSILRSAQRSIKDIQEQLKRKGDLQKLSESFDYILSTTLLDLEKINNYHVQSV